jgi:hypothetical protein
LKFKRVQSELDRFVYRCYRARMNIRRIRTIKVNPIDLRFRRRQATVITGQLEYFALHHVNRLVRLAPLASFHFHRSFILVVVVVLVFFFSPLSPLPRFTLTYSSFVIQHHFIVLFLINPSSPSSTPPLSPSTLPPNHRRHHFHRHPRYLLFVSSNLVRHPCF